MKITAISDLHGFQPKLNDGDLLIIAGDCTLTNTLKEWASFFGWLKKQQYEKKIIVAGNHDRFFESGFPKNQKEAEELKEVKSFLREQGEIEEKEDFEYLCDSGTEFKGLKIWGSPWTKNFIGQNDDFKAFGLLTETQMMEKWELIPNNIDILITHSPPYGILDKSRNGNRSGCINLRNSVLNGSKFPNLKLHVFGHIHECGGEILETTLTKFVNCSIMNEDYEPLNKQVNIML